MLSHQVSLPNIVHIIFLPESISINQHTFSIPLYFFYSPLQTTWLYFTDPTINFLLYFLSSKRIELFLIPTPIPLLSFTSLFDCVLFIFFNIIIGV